MWIVRPASRKATDEKKRAEIASLLPEVVDICNEGIGNIDIDVEKKPGFSSSELLKLASSYCSSRRLRTTTAADKVKTLLQDGVKSYAVSSEDDRAFISHLSNGFRSVREITGRPRVERYLNELGAYVLCLMDLAERAKKERHQLISLFWLGLGLAIITSFSLRIRQTPLWIIDPIARCAAAVGLATCIYWFIKLRYIQPLARSSIRRTIGNGIQQLHRGRALSLQLRAGTVRPVEPLEAEIFTLAILNPRALRQRVNDYYEPNRRTLIQRVTAEIQVPGELITPSEPGSAEAEDARQWSDSRRERFAKLGRIPLPVIIPNKGDLNDDFEVSNEGGSRIPCFSYSEYLDIVASVLRMLLLKAYAAKTFEELPAEAAAAERRALRCIMQRGTPPATEIHSVITEIMTLTELTDGAVQANKEKSAQIKDRESIRIIADLVTHLSGRYAIVAFVDCGSDGRAVLQYQRRIIPGLKLKSREEPSPAQWLRDVLSILLGARPVDLSVSLENAPTCQSFHLTFDCPDGLYLREQQLPGLEEYLRKHNPPQNVIPPYYRVRSRLGQSYAHFYCRHFPRPELGESLPLFRVKFLEVPPGSLFRAAIVSISSAALVWLVGFVISHRVEPGTDIPAILLAFPAVAAAWLGFDEKRRRLLEGTLLARVSLILSACWALGGSALFMMNSSKISILHEPIPFPIRISFFGIDDVSWGILAALSALNAFGIALLCVLRTWEFKLLCSRQSVSSAHER